MPKPENQKPEESPFLRSVIPDLFRGYPNKRHNNMKKAAAPQRQAKRNGQHEPPAGQG